MCVAMPRQHVHRHGHTVAWLLAVVVALVAALALPLLLLSAAEASERLHTATEELRATGPRTTLSGRLRGALARQSWLGPFRPRPAPDPLEECGGVLGNSQAPWEALRSLKENRRRLACLQQHVRLPRRSRVVTFVVLGMDLARLALLLVLVIRLTRDAFPETTGERREMPGDDPLGEGGARGGVPPGKGRVRWTRLRGAHTCGGRVDDPPGEGDTRDVGSPGEGSSGCATPREGKIRWSVRVTPVLKVQGGAPPGKGDVRDDSPPVKDRVIWPHLTPPRCEMQGDVPHDEGGVREDAAAGEDRARWGQVTPPGEETGGAGQSVGAISWWAPLRVPLTPQVTFIVHLAEDFVPAWYNSGYHRLLGNVLQLEALAWREAFVAGSLSPEDVQALLQRAAHELIDAP